MAKEGKEKEGPLVEEVPNPALLPFTSFFVLSLF
jgi:hypothetical protein